MIKTVNFYPGEPPIGFTSKITGEYRDIRNGLICVDPTCDMTCYINYINLLNMNRDKWKQFGYLDLGMMPIAMGPSFFHSTIVEFLTSVCSSAKIPVYPMKAATFLQLDCRVVESDLWAFKSDVAAVTGIPVHALTVEKFIRWCEKNEYFRAV